MFQKNSTQLIVLIVVFIVLSFFVFPEIPNYLLNILGFKNIRFPEKQFHLGLDLLGGAHLVYQADLSQVNQRDQKDALEGVRDVIERRVNVYGVKEPIVQITGKDRLIVELPQVKDINEAINLIGETPFLEFKEVENFNDTATESLNFVSTNLSGKDIKRAFLSFDQNTFLPQVSLEFNERGAELLSQITKRNLGKPLAIFLDGQLISAPIVQDEITNGKAVITGRFNIEEAKKLAQRLSSGALPVPIKLISQQVIGPTLGKESLEKSLKAGIYGLIAIAIFMIAYYRLFGLVAVFALLIYMIFVLTVFKIIPVTLTLAGIAGFILSLGMAVDGNILIFARIREELKEGKSKLAAIDYGFQHAWYSIRDSQITTLIAAVILYIFSTSSVKGFALTLAIGTIFSIFSAIYVTKLFLKTFLRL